MTWAKAARDALLRGEEVTLRQRGDSMAGRIEDGARVTLRPIESGEPSVGDVILASVKGRDCLNVVKAIDRGTFFVGDNIGRIGGWIERDAIYGVVVSTED